MFVTVTMECVCVCEMNYFILVLCKLKSAVRFIVLWDIE